VRKILANEVIKMRRMKLFNLVQYLKSLDFYHDTFDLEEEGIREVLQEYDIYDELTEEEVQELSKDLFELAEQNEFREAVVLAANAASDGMMEVES